jgi:HD superfamily phosphohydrolase
MAGLCHDMGHGPFSHVFDNEFIPRAAKSMNKVIKWKHEDASEMMLEAAIRYAGLDDFDRFDDALEPKEIQFVKELINPDRYPAKVYPDRKYLYEIVSNSRCSVDVDKFDYLLRDSANSGVPNAFNPRRLMRNCRVIDNEVCFDEKDFYTLYTLFQQRYSMFKQVYSHRVGKAIELMVCDILLEAEPVFHFTEKLHDAASYLSLTDSILRFIAYSDDPRLAKARDLCQRLFSRDLYPMAAERIIYKHLDSVKPVTPEDIFQRRPENSALQLEDILVQNMTLNYAMKDKNPIDYITFYNNKRPDEKVGLKPESVSMLTPTVFQEKYIRVFLRRRREDDVLVQDARHALLAYLSERHKQDDRDLRTLSQVDVGSQVSQAPLATPRKRTLSRAPTLQMGENSELRMSVRAGAMLATPVVPVPVPTALPSSDSEPKRGRSVAFDVDIDIEDEFSGAASMSQRQSQPSQSQEGPKRQKLSQTTLGKFFPKK